MSDVSEDIALQSREILQTFVWWEHVHVQTSAKFSDFAELYIFAHF